jgi:hypothetical protein
MKQILKNYELIRHYAVLRIQSMGNKTVQKHNDLHRVSQSVRLTSRIVVEARKKHEDITLKELIFQANFACENRKEFLSR